MLFRFSLYGFLKNQRYFEPFLLLVFLDRGLSFFEIGLLLGFREVTVNLLEVPSGAVADLYGRRRSMVLSISAYLLSFGLFAEGRSLPILFAAMALYACGDAFRTGTHKAIILDWLRQQGRSEERTRVYGFTRSWSKLGSALSALVAGALVFFGGEGGYSRVFWFAMVPYAVNLVNLATYPASLDGQVGAERGARATLRHLGASLRHLWTHRPLRRLVFESVGFEGVYASVKDYLQPVLQAAALTLPLLVAFPERQRTAVLVGLTYAGLSLLSAGASRQAHRLAAAAGGEEPAARRIWRWTALSHTGLLVLLLAGWHLVAVAGFVGLAVLQNLWRPILVARYDAQSEPEQAATLLSADAQAKSLAAMVLAPLLGAAVDHLVAAGAAATLWPIAVPGVVAAVLALRLRSSG